ncbi:uncharacterized protein FA14DRAFT_87028 [Meira miltonrushii]|uniref:Secreted protein n=1 Tax=Meira miltonrushii TaxID=1280837 RepID=A0A316V420_9BASI|nr:uncharacterized protein FA14DRAFT_87028 [Meira miltonrushii]PWN32296.1 hypothetical protein FA14DRAFT_87028 [Meira miltonrushii]
MTKLFIFYLFIFKYSRLGFSASHHKENGVFSQPGHLPFVSRAEIIFFYSNIACQYLIRLYNNNFLKTKLKEHAPFLLMTPQFTVVIYIHTYFIRHFSLSILL